ncbi:thioredoxin family protein [Streptococcus pneumoniae]
MITPYNLEELAGLIEKPRKCVFFFSADWCGDCQYIKPFLPEIEAENPEFDFVWVDRDAYLDLAKLWNIYGIPSLVVLENGKELGRLVNRNRKSKQEINEFLAKVKG